MKKIWEIIAILITAVPSLAGNFTFIPVEAYRSDFSAAYAAYPEIPQGILEAVSYTQTRMRHIEPTEEAGNCMEMPMAFGVMGLMDDPSGFFRNSLGLVSELSGILPQEMGQDPGIQIMAWAASFDHIRNEMGITSSDLEDFVPVLAALSEIPVSKDSKSLFPLDTYLYSVYSFLNEPEFQVFYNIPDYDIDLKEIFGDENLRILSASKVSMSSEKISNDLGDVYNPYMSMAGGPCYEYPGVIWAAANPSNYSSRSGTAISAITVHTMQGSYAGSISWFQNPAANVSAHYNMRSADGQITQMVCEADKAWHVGTENPYTLGIEHEGYVSDPSWYTEAMYNNSASLVRDIAGQYGINRLRTYFKAATSGINTLGGCIRIKGHQHYPNQTHTDPGVNWDWEKYYQLINNDPVVTNYGSSSGTLYDSGGVSAAYGNDERYIHVIAPVGANSVTITFSSFNLETNWDYLFVYDGVYPDGNLIGSFTGSIDPGTITATSGAISLEFRSDCLTTAAGYAASWTSEFINLPTTSIADPPEWNSSDFNVSFSDNADAGIKTRFYQPLFNNGTEWRANPSNGFFNDNFDISIHSSWTQASGSWGINTAHLMQSDELNGNSNIYTELDQDAEGTYLYRWSSSMSGTGTNRRSGLHFFCSDPELPNRGESYLVWFRVDQDKLEIYRISGDVLYLESTTLLSVDSDTWYDYKVTFNPSSGLIEVFRNDEFLASWTDPSPITTGSYVSLRNGNSDVQYDNLKVYRSRNASNLISVGNTSSDDIMSQNSNPEMFACRIKSLILDNLNYWSNEAAANTRIDWTAPVNFTVNDGAGPDLDISPENDFIQTNWTSSSDPNSGISHYELSLGTSPGSSDIANWANAGISNDFLINGLSFLEGTTYYVSVKAVNNAGLQTVISSDGFTIAPETPVCNPNLAVTGMNAVPSPSGTNVSLSWDQMPDAAMYQVKGRRLGTVPFGTFVTANTSKNVGGLIPGTTYEWKIRYSCSSSGLISTFTTLQQFSTVPPLRIREARGAFKLDISPNPFTDIIEISLPENNYTENDALIYLSNSLGQVIKIFEPIKNTRSQRLDLSHLPQGIYFLKLKSEKGDLSGKLIKR